MTPHNVKTAITYGTSLIGTQYGWWKGGELNTCEAMWNDNNKVPDTIPSVSCAGLTNLMLRQCGLRLPESKLGGVGGTMAYYDYYNALGKTHKFCNQKDLPNGTLIGRKYTDVNDQGHVGVIVYKNGKMYVLQSFPEEGVNDKYTLGESHAGYYYEYYVLPEDWLNPI